MATDWREELNRMLGPSVWNGRLPDDSLDPEHEDVVERRVEFGEGGGHQGFHGREASDFVKLAQRFDAEIRVSVGGDDWENAKTYGNGRNGSVDATSIFGVSRFCGVFPGHPFILRAKGPDAEEAVQELGDALEFRHRF